MGMQTFDFHCLFLLYLFSILEFYYPNVQVVSSLPFSKGAKIHRLTTVLCVPAESL
ncbi:hypothetical protein HMPREF1145_1861 [Oribacterium parvum ACB8]|nr:hypothetical protein HMPREF1145_1861 [Oribacterium parvum ACB8]